MKYFITLFFITCSYSFGQTPYRPTEEELKHEELRGKMRDRTIDPANFFKQIFGTKIIFYGQVVDWNGASVEGAEVTYSPLVDFRSFAGKDPDYKMMSGKNGLFTIIGKGKSLYVSVRKEGYRQVGGPPPFAKKDAPGGWIGSSGNFDYYNGEGRPELNHHPMEEQPVKFVIRKIGELEPLKERDGLWYFRRPQEPLTISLKGKGSSEHCIQIVCLSECKGTAQQKDYSHYDWRFELKVENGGVIEQMDDGYEAPESGYVPSVTLASMSAAAAEWRDGFSEKKYYVRFDDGVCARVSISGGTSWENFQNKPYVNMTSYLNPNPKSRNLEAPPIGR